MLNRVLTWTDLGVSYEADQRHAELFVQELGLGTAKPVTTPGSREDVENQHKQNDAEDKLLEPKDATLYRALTARLNYLAQDRVELLYAAKECSRRMATPRTGDWFILKRVGRYLAGSPRVVQLLRWQVMPKQVDTHVDSDWARCKETRRSTSGGVVRLGSHDIKA